MFKLSTSRTFFLTNRLNINVENLAQKLGFYYRGPFENYFGVQETSELIRNLDETITLFFDGKNDDGFSTIRADCSDVQLIKLLNEIGDNTLTVSLRDAGLNLRTQTSINGGLYVFLQYPAREHYCLAVDGCLHEKEEGWKGYEHRQTGSVSNLFRGLAFIVSELNKKVNLSQLPINKINLSEEFICKIHHAFTSGITKHYSVLWGPGIRPGCYREDRGYVIKFECNPNDITTDGLEEIIEMIDAFDDDYFPALRFSNFLLEHLDLNAAHITLDFLRKSNIGKWKKNLGLENNKELAKAIMSAIQKMLKDKDYNNKDDHILYYTCSNMNKVSQKIQSVMDDYNKSIGLQKNNDDEKLFIIAKCIWELEHLHPFYDGNTRTFSIGLLNFLLILNNFIPITPYNPRVVDGCSVKEMVKHIEEGMENTLRLIAGKKDLFGYITPDPEFYSDAGDREIAKTYNCALIQALDEIRSQCSMTDFENAFNDMVNQNRVVKRLIMKVKNELGTSSDSHQIFTFPKDDKSKSCTEVNSEEEEKKVKNELKTSGKNCLNSSQFLTPPKKSGTAVKSEESTTYHSCK